MRIEVLPATDDRWADVQVAVGHGDGTSCSCQWYWLAGKEFSALKSAERRERLHSMVAADRAPGLVAYVDGVPAGWCGFGPRAEMPRLERSRVIPKVDERPVWSVVCFLIRKEFRSMRLMDALLDGVIEYARARGVGCLEAYPADTDGRRLSPEAGYVGILSVFERHGFAKVADTSSHADGLPRVIVRLELGD